jgi:hypothetical protein
MKAYKLNILTAILLVIGLAGCEKDVTMTGLTINKTELTLGFGQKAILTAGSEPIDGTNAKYAWSSSNPAIATVEPYGEGWTAWVDGVGIGTTEITLTSGGFSKTVKVEVTVTSITVTNDEGAPQGSYERGDEVQLTAVIVPNQGVTPLWESSNTAVATVTQAGLVTVVGNGTAIVSASVGPIRGEFSVIAMSLFDLAAGHWRFDDPSNLALASVGQNLRIEGTVHSVDGPAADNKAITITRGEHNLMWDHTMGEPEDFTFLWDIKIPVTPTGPGSTDYVAAFWNGTNGDGSFFFRHRDGYVQIGAGSYTNVAEYLTDDDAPWMRLVIVFSATNGVVSIYRDGVLMGDQPRPGETRWRIWADHPVYWMCDNPGDSENRPAPLSELAAWSRALTPAEIASLGGVRQ